MILNAETKMLIMRMIEYIKKDITTVKSGIVLHGVNCSGIAYGSGVAGDIRKKWPAAYKMYKDRGGGSHLLGSINFIISIKDSVIIANGYTQINYGRDYKKYADINAIEKCVKLSVEVAEAFNKSLYLPKIGCGLGGLSWEDDVKSIIEKISNDFPNVHIYICNI